MIFDPPQVIGHRGAGRDNGNTGELPENTVESFGAAVAQGAHWIELDVRRNAEDSLWLYHDAALADGRAILELDDAQCRQAGLATLAEAMECLPPDFPVNVEVKSVMEDAVAPEPQRTVALLAPTLRAESRRRRLLVSSFDPAVVLALATAAPEVARGWMPWVRGPLDLAVSGAVGLGCHAVGIDARSFGADDAPLDPAYRTVAGTVELAHRAGLQVYTWCPAPQDAAAFLEQGVDAVCVDDVPATLAALHPA